MSEGRDRDPTRLTKGDVPRTPEERWLRRAFSEAAEMTASGDEHVRARTMRRAPRRMHRRPLQIAIAVVVVMLAGATFAAFQRFVLSRLAARVVTSAPSEPTRPAHALVARPISVAEADTVPAPARTAPIERRRRIVASAAPSDAPTTPRPAVAALPAPPAVAALPAPPAVAALPAPPAVAALSVPRPRWPVDDAHPTPLAPAAADEQTPTEAHLLARAISHLRGDHDAAAALADLADYDRRFPSGLLEQEVLRIRTEALLDVGHDQEALARLDERAADALTRPLLLLRGELRARAGRCAEALRDLGPLADESQTPSVLAGRALYARASCHAQLGDVAAARADLERYEARFPDGSFHADAAAFLRATTP